MIYRVSITKRAHDKIIEQGRYIAVDRKSPLNADRWLDRVFEAIESLADFPHRCPVAPESSFRDYQIRRLRIGDYHLLFTIDEQKRKVTVMTFRHGSRLPQPDELPDEPPDLP